MAYRLAGLRPLAPGRCPERVLAPTRCVAVASPATAGVGRGEAPADWAPREASAVTGRSRGAGVPPPSPRPCPEPASSPDLLTLEQCAAAARARSLALSLSTFGPFFKVVVTTDAGVTVGELEVRRRGAARRGRHRAE